MDLQIIKRNGQPEYAVLSWESYQELLQAAGRHQPVAPVADQLQPAPQEVQPGLDQLRSLREGKGLALEVLARTVGISPSYLSMIERGEREPDRAICRSLAWELGVSGWRDAS